MDNTELMIQSPAPGTHLLMFRGDTRAITLSLPRPQKGSAWFRTNIGHAEITKNEIIREVRNNQSPLGRDWFDIPMNQLDDRNFQITIPFCEVGHFEGKCFFMGEGEYDPTWPKGPNAVFNVEPADNCCSNIIYNAFVRQFGVNKDGKKPNKLEESCIQTLDKEGYTVIPPSGTFRDLIRELDFIVGELGCRMLLLLPVHPTPTTYARMGRFGSPYAALSFTAIDPALAEFDPQATPLEQFVELVDEIHLRNARILIDIAVNHTGWAARLHEIHPEWLVRDKDGHIEVPGAWGTLWEDLTKLDYTHKDLWIFIADVFLTWCQRGVDGFRCDAGYMIPVPAWKYIIATVRQQYPDTVFLLEGLGGEISLTRDILNTANFDYAYSELFQNYDREQIENYLPEAMEISHGDGITIHFAETHDNSRLAARSKTYARMRTGLSALCSHQGGFGFANGVEWYATEKINVHNSPSLNWGAEPNQVRYIQRLNTLLKAHPAFHDRTDLKMVQNKGGNHIVLLRHNIPSGKKLLVLVNLDDENQTLASWNAEQAGMQGIVLVDLLTEKKVTITNSGELNTFFLGPAQTLCLSADRDDIDMIRRIGRQAFLLPERIEKQRLRAKALDVFRFYQGNRDIGEFKPDLAAEQMAKDPVGYCRNLNPFSEESRVVIWQWPHDVKREVMIPSDHFLMIRANASFRARIVIENMGKDRVKGYEESLPCADGTFFVIFSPSPPPKEHCSTTLKLTIYTPGRCEHVDAPLLFLSRAEEAKVKRVFNKSELRTHSLLFMGTNCLGGMLRARVFWGELKSRYDALLAANLHSDFPFDRWVMLTRCRTWVVFQGYSHEIRFDSFNSFCFEYNSCGFWRYQVPTGQGEYILLTIGVEMISGKNAVRLVFFRHHFQGEEGILSDKKKIRLIIRPDIENRNFHEITKAYQGPEDLWPKSVTEKTNGFSFMPDPEHNLELVIDRGTFVREPEWHYMVHRPMEAERGLEPDSDLFSPGYFVTFLEGGRFAQLTAQIANTKEDNSLPPSILTGHMDKSIFQENFWWTMDDAMKQAVDHYVVKRKQFNTIIAGYPWFLDWGRDSLIFVRGLIATGRTDESRNILKQFGWFEKDGTIPNMIRGEDAGNRDTSDAALWFFVACSDLINAEGGETFLDSQCGGRTIRQILISLGHSLINGTSNGIIMDPESGLIFSPAHFTWMDTNHPAGTPRQGYPIEIQSLWHHALSFLARIDSVKFQNSWDKIAQQVQSSILDLFLLEEDEYLSDCLHANPGEPARQAKIDDALRPNQLFAVTLGAVTENTICRNIVAACEELLVPGAIRSLADRHVRLGLSVNHNGKVINDPNYPYWGIYTGDEDTRRKPAYHNGTAWTWLFPTFCEAWVKVYGNKGKQTALSWLASSTRIINEGCAGHVPEIVDGDYPHWQRGCDAQAWGASELIRVWLQLND